MPGYPQDGQRSDPAWRNHFPIKVYAFFFPSTQGRTEVNDPIRLEFELIWDFTPVLDIYKFGEDLIKNDWEKVETQFPPLKLNGSFRLPWQPQFWSSLLQNIMQPFPYPVDAIHKIGQRLANWS